MEATDVDKQEQAVERALLRSAKGYRVKETIEEDSEKYGRKTRTTQYQVPGDVRAQIFWLKNRRPESWSDRPQGRPRAAEGVNIVDDIPEGDDGSGVP